MRYPTTSKLTTEDIGRVIVKIAQVGVPAKKRKKKQDTPEFDYSRSLIPQLKKDPTTAGLKRGLGSGAVGAVLGALITRMLTDDPKLVGGGALAGGLVGAIPGYRSGKQEALGDYSRLLFLRRLGITRPGELEATLRMKGTPAPRKVMEEEAVI